MPIRKTSLFIILFAFACAPSGDETSWVVGKLTHQPPERTAAQKLTELRGLHGPESVKYDPQLDVYFISNMAGYGSDKDGMGYILKVDAGDLSNSTVFIESGKGGARLDAPKGMAIHGDTLWVADIDVMRAFDRRTGAALTTIDFKPRGAILLNDVALGGDGKIYISDTGILMTDKGVKYVGGDKIFSIGPGGAVSVVAQGSQLKRPNGVKWDSAHNRLIVVSFDPFHSEVYSINPANGQKTTIARGIGKFDGVELLQDGRMLVSCWNDNSVHLIGDGRDVMIATNLWQPADIGLDTRRNRLAVPEGTNDRVELWRLPQKD